MNYVMDFLKIFDGAFQVIYYVDGDEDPLWEGSLWNTPWWIANMELDIENAESGQPVSYRNSLGKNYNDKPGLVILVKDKEE